MSSKKVPRMLTSTFCPNVTRTDCKKIKKGDEKEIKHKKG